MFLDESVTFTAMVSALQLDANSNHQVDLDFLKLYADILKTLGATAFIFGPEFAGPLAFAGNLLALNVDSTTIFKSSTTSTVGQQKLADLEAQLATFVEA